MTSGYGSFDSDLLYCEKNPRFEVVWVLRLLLMRGEFSFLLDDVSVRDRKEVMFFDDEFFAWWLGRG